MDDRDGRRYPRNKWRGLIPGQIMLSVTVTASAGFMILCSHAALRGRPELTLLWGSVIAVAALLTLASCALTAWVCGKARHCDAHPDCRSSEREKRVARFLLRFCFGIDIGKIKQDLREKAPEIEG